MRITWLAMWLTDLVILVCDRVDGDLSVNYYVTVAKI
jgi:hypothetical protein